MKDKGMKKSSGAGNKTDNGAKSGLKPEPNAQRSDTTAKPSTKNPFPHGFG